jgi:site-specific DNA recombinase
MKTCEAQPKIKAAGYCRVSTPGQAKEGLSLADQEQRIRDFAKAKGIELVAVYVEAGKSGRKDYTKARPEFQKLLADAGAGKFDAVIVYEIKRWTRNAKDYHNVKALLDAARVGLLDVTDPGFDPKKPGDRFFRALKVEMGEMQAADSTQRSIDVKQSKLDDGHYNLGQRIPYGLRWTDKVGSALEHDPEMFRVWQLMMYLREQGWGYGRIARALNGDEKVKVDDRVLEQYGVTLPVPNRFGMKVWREGAIASMFRDPSRYTGESEIQFKTSRGDAKPYTVQFPPLMTKAQFDRFLALARKNLCWVPRNVGKGSLLSSLCKCGICGATLQVTGSHKCRYYGCADRLRPPQGKSRCPLPLIPKTELERRVMLKVAAFLLDDSEFERALALASPTKGGLTEAELDRQGKRLTEEVRKAQTRLGHLVEAVADGLLEAADIKAEKGRIQAEQDRLAQQQAGLDVKRAGLTRNAERVKQIEEYRTWATRKAERAEDLLGLPMEEQRDLLRSLLPLGSGACIKVEVPEPMTPEQVQHRVFGRPPKRLSYSEYVESLPKWRLEISGLLPVEQAELKFAVLGGAPAVP